VRSPRSGDPVDSSRRAAVHAMFNEDKKTVYGIIFSAPVSQGAAAGSK
jgi:hypothetical protein